MIQPLFKWTGGKNRMRKKYGVDFWPDEDFSVFVDAFYGGGAVTHWVAEKYPNVDFIINDANTELVELYRQLRDSPEAFIDIVNTLEETYLFIDHEDNKQRKAYYNTIKLEYIDGYGDPVKDAASLFFMMKINFNGWWKVYNYSKGMYATPPGTVHHKEPFIDKGLLRATSAFFRNRVINIQNGDFATIMPPTDSKAYLYFDPPYRDSTTVYTTDGFDDKDQIRLCEFMQYCDTLGHMVSMSNKEIGDGFWQHHLGNMDILEYEAKYTAGRGVTTNDVKEILVRNFAGKLTNISRLF